MSNPLKKTMVYLGLAEEELVEQQEAAERPAAKQPVAEQPAAAPAAVPAPAPRASVTPLRKTTVTRQAAPAGLNEILTVHPKQYKDAQGIAATFRDGIPVIINLSQMSEGDARRLIDFASGLSQGLNGKIERVTGKVFLLSPEHISVLGDEAAPADAQDPSTFFAQ
ncbi:cell division protein SepF [Mycetocola reblochoni]|uniref:Cell division protein SepF n=2 Tax=Mycetocola reblochoni TaxID=331618 RepID=A0A1R4J6K8_9MICO|nr:cell division protein SepF [Mycetocola reblochoni]RLP69620.1 cell division protein SepF [Mycetocola reblochoni]SJN27687.1 hypothetical protein FM119_05805 [Mycetocola reblochoni REB411]